MNIAPYIITGISGTKLQDSEKSFIQENQIGGILLFKKNYETPQQLRSLCDEIQLLANALPFFISVDQEGGRVQRFKKDFTLIPPMIQVSKKFSPNDCFEIHRYIGLQLACCGINLNFSPCADILSELKNDVIGDRSFGDNSKIVSQYAKMAIRGLKQSHILSCAKHFPGHGMTVEDSHYKLPYINHSWEDLEKSDLLPFKTTIDEDVPFIMTAHLQANQIDDQFPLSLSNETYKYLHNHLSFSGISITDDLNMWAIGNNYSLEDSVEVALTSGATMVIIRNFEDTWKVANHFDKKSLSFPKKLKIINKIKERIIPNLTPSHLIEKTLKESDDQFRQLLDQ